MGNQPLEVPTYVYSSRGTLPPKRVRGRGLLGDLVQDPEKVVGHYTKYVGS